MNVGFYTMVRNSVLLLIAILGILICACSTPPESREDTPEKSIVSEKKASPAAVIESVRTEETPELTTVTFVCSMETTCGKPTTLANPARLSFDIAGKPATDLPRRIPIEKGPLTEILIQEKAPAQTRVVIFSRYEVSQTRLIAKGRDIVLTVMQASSENEAEQVRPTPALPRIVDVTVTQRPGNRTRLIVTTDKKVAYDVKLEGKALVVSLKNGAIDQDLLKRLESTHAEGAIERVQAFYSPRDGHVWLRVMLREPIPYHVSQDGMTLNIDFDALEVAAKQSMKTTPVSAQKNVPERQTLDKGKKPTAALPTADTSRAVLLDASSKQYAGQRMSFDFVDADIRNILQLISEVAGINIVWGTDVEGKISLKLDNVQWDQALEMILKPNGLTYQIEGDVMWVVPRSKLIDIEVRDSATRKALLAEKRAMELFEAKIIEFITIRHRKASDVFILLALTLDIQEKKKMTAKQKGEEESAEAEAEGREIFGYFDPGTNMIILNGTRRKIEQAKELIAKLDVPEKQVLIEARIVEATTGFSRDLGIQWQSMDGKNPGFKSDWINTGANFSGATSFSTNAPANWAPNIGMAFGWLTGGGLGTVSLDASLALGESDSKAHVISAPKVLAVNGGEAFISRGTVEYFPISTLDTIDYKEIPAVLSLKVTPTVSADNSHVTMAIEVTDDKTLPAKTTSSATGEETESPPGRSTKSIKSTLMVRTGDTVVIGGIYQKQEELSDSGVPWLKDIPILGWLFKAEYDRQARTELLIFLTPTVVDTLKTSEG